MGRSKSVSSGIPCLTQCQILVITTGHPQIWILLEFPWVSWNCTRSLLEFPWLPWKCTTSLLEFSCVFKLEFSYPPGALSEGSLWVLPRKPCCGMCPGLLPRLLHGKLAWMRLTVLLMLREEERENAHKHVNTFWGLSRDWVGWQKFVGFCVFWGSFLLGETYIYIYIYTTKSQKIVGQSRESFAYEFFSSVFFFRSQMLMLRGEWVEGAVGCLCRTDAGGHQSTSRLQRREEGVTMVRYSWDTESWAREHPPIIKHVLPFDYKCL